MCIHIYYLNERIHVYILDVCVHTHTCIYIYIYVIYKNIYGIFIYVRFCVVFLSLSGTFIHGHRQLAVGSQLRASG